MAKMTKMTKRTFPLTVAAAAGSALLLSGCAGAARAMTESAGGKNLGLDGYVMLGEVEMNSSETGTPTGKLIIGRLTYKSRKVGIPADQKVPTAGYFKSTKTKSLFGTEEAIIEYDFTAGSDADAARALEILEAKRKSSETAPDSAPPSASVSPASE